MTQEKEQKQVEYKRIMQDIEEAKQYLDEKTEKITPLMEDKYDEILNTTELHMNEICRRAN